MSDPNDMATANAAPKVEARLARLNRQLPWAPEAESGLISCLLHDPRRVVECAARLPVEAFYHEQNQTVLQALYRMQEKDQQITVMSLTHQLRDANKLDLVGGPANLSELYSFMPMAAQFEFFLAQVVRDYLRRKMIEACAAGIEDAMNFNDEEQEGEIPDARLMLDLVQQRTFDVLQLASNLQDTDGGPVKASVFMMSYVDHLERVMANVGKVLGLHTGLPDVDRIICGLDDKRGEMLIVGARPGHGKTALLGTWLKNMCIDGDIPTLCFSMEMATDQIMDRIVFGGFGIDTNKARTGMMSNAEKDAVGLNIRKVQRAPLWMDESAEVNTVEFRSRVEMMVRLHGIKLLVVDYLQLIKPCTKIGRSEERLAITEALTVLHLLKKRHKLVIIVAAQLNQNIEKTPGRRHMLSDFAGSDAIGKYADYAMFITRPSEVKRWKDLTDKVRANRVDGWKEHRKAQPGRWAGMMALDAEETKEAARNRGAGYAQPADDDRPGQHHQKPKGKVPKAGFAEDYDEEEAAADQNTRLVVNTGETWVFDNERDWDESAELQLVKNRNGPTPDIPIRFRREFARFDTRTPKVFSNNADERQH
jgi:replicative DNA helicase